jgi:hypothetical protein
MATRLIIREAEAAPATAAGSQPNPEEFEKIPEPEQRSKYIRPIILKVKGYNPGKQWSEIEDEVVKNIKKLKDIYNDKKGQIDVNAVVDQLITGPIQTAQQSAQPSVTPSKGDKTNTQQKTAKPEDLKKTKKEPSVFIDKLNKIKKAFKLNKEQTTVIKNLNNFFMRATATLQEQKFTKKYVEQKIDSEIGAGAFEDFDELGKKNIIKILKSVFLSIYFPSQASPADAEVSLNIVNVAE